MILYPAIDLKEGQCVRLLQGDYEQVTIYGSNPSEMAKKWESEGGRYLHLVDLDGAKLGKSVNEEAIRRIVRVLEIPIELGGGIRTLEDIEKKLALGVTRVILGSAAVANKALVEQAINRFGKEKIVVGVDAKNGMVAVEGWLQVTNLSAVSFCKELEAIGVETVIYTDIAKDGMLQGPNIEETKSLIEETNLKIVASGGVSTMEDLEKLAAIGVEGAIIGKALYTDKIVLREAVERFQGV